MNPEERLTAIEALHERSIEQAPTFTFNFAQDSAVVKMLAETEEILRRIRAMSPPSREQEPSPSRRITSATPRHEPPNDLPGIGSGRG